MKPYGWHGIRVVPHSDGDMVLLTKVRRKFIANALRELADVYRTVGGSKTRINDLDFAAYSFEELVKRMEK